jgi:cyanophycinase-like exopeptidase
MDTRPSPLFLLAGAPGAGGGVYRPLIREILQLPGKRKPRVAYLGAASDDDPRFSAFMERLIRSAGDCAFRLAPQVDRKGGRGGAREVIEEADLVFLGGGDVELGMRRLLERDLTGTLQQKYRSGTPFFGVSAGAILLCRQWIRWRDPEDDGSAELFDCLGLAPVLCDCHGEEDGWAELKALLRLAGGRALGHGLRAGAAVRVTADGTTEPVCGTVDRLGVRRGKVVAR